MRWSRSRYLRVPAAAAIAIATAGPAKASAQAVMAGMDPAMHDHASEHSMFTRQLGSWRLLGMGQLFPLATSTRPSVDDTPLDGDATYLTQVVGMFDLQSSGERWVLRVTPNLEGVTIEDGERTLGGWGEGFLDKRHPHTLLHEFVLTWTQWGEGNDGVSLAAGKGFAPYGTEDPMARPGVKYPTNHHLSQALERWLVSATVLESGWGVEASVFGGTEPDGPYDFSNIESFGDSWSVRASRRFGGEGIPGTWPLELSASFASIDDGPVHHDEDEPHEPGSGSTAKQLWNVATRLDAPVSGGRLYGLLEYSNSDEGAEPGLWGVLAEVQYSKGPHRPYARIDRSVRPEYTRRDEAGKGFFRYDHDSAPIGRSAWTIWTLGYGYTLTDGSISSRPFVELQRFGVDDRAGGVSATDLLGADAGWGITFGVRLFLGGDPMRMGSYGVLDPMARMRSSGSMPGMGM